MDLKNIEQEIQEKWKKDGTVEKIVEFPSKGKKFYLLDGPPYVNGVPHIGHTKTIVFKDMWGKFKTMQGYDVWFQPGFDCGGLPIENKVEKKLKVRSKKDIEEIGIDKFIEECKNFAEENKSVWMDLYKNLGAWKGWKEPYMTHKNYYLESGWWTIKQLYEKGMFVESKKPGFWCPHCETVLSGYETTDSYKDVEDPSIYIKFKIKDVDEYLLVWTTTPWTLPANVAITVHPDETYLKIELNGEKLILAEKLIEDVLSKIENPDYKLIKKLKGSELEGIKYEPVIDVEAQRKLENAHRVILSIPILKKKIASKTYLKMNVDEENNYGHTVSMDTGSGLVHTAPGHGDIDNKLGKHYELPEISPVDEQGKFTDQVENWKGMFVKDADKKIIEYLKEKDLLLISDKIVHSYPLCWRCKTPLIYRMSNQWFLKIDTIRDNMLSELEKIESYPEFAKERLEKLIIDSPDWAVTRQRYWGIPLPLWECQDCGKRTVIGSLKELKEKSGQDINDLHKHVVDKIKIKCDECGKDMTRLPDIMDVWFDSSISPWASIGYPHKNKELYEKLKDVDLVDESQDQIRGWFYYLMFMSKAMQRKPYKTLCLNGWTLDEKGEKMSKSLGNVIFAEDAYNELGSDLLRFFCCVETPPWEVQKISLEKAKEFNNFFNVLWNVKNFIETYGKDTTKIDFSSLKKDDEWILSKLNNLIKDTTENMETFNFHFVARGLMNFVVNDLSRTYVKLVRNRSDDNVSAIINNCLIETSKLLAPISPFISEKIYLSFKKDSVHLSKWPEYDKETINKELEEKMEIAMDIITNTNAIRKETGIKLRWPLQKVVIDGMNLEEVKEIISSMGNIKEVCFDEVEKPSKEFTKNEKEIKIFLETEMSEELKKEALLREVQRKIQSLRKKNGLVVEDKIDVLIDKSIQDKLKEFEEELKKNVGAEKIEYTKIDEDSFKFMDKEIGITIVVK